MSDGLRDLRIWTDAVTLGGDVVKAMRPHVRRETKVISDAVMTTALAVGAHIADGYARYTPAEQRESYLLAKRALFRLESELAVARQAEVLPAPLLRDFTARSTRLTKMLTGFLVYLEKQLGGPDPAPPPDTASRDSGRVPS